jgi:hypothetical protein
LNCKLFLFKKSKVIKKEILYFEVLTIDRRGTKEILGAVKFPLDKIERQEEYDLELEIPDENDERIITAKINAKIKFIWSIYHSKLKCDASKDEQTIGKFE